MSQQVLPSRMVLQVYKIKAVGAKKGFELLKKKSDALKKAFRAILQRIVESKVRMGSDFKEASIGLASAYFAAGDFSRNVLDNVKQRTSVRLNTTTENIAGVRLPSFNLRGEDEVNEDSSLLGLSGGGQAIHRAREAYTKFLKVLIVIASLQTQFVTLDIALKVTNRRVNALEFILIPKIKGIIDFIDSELDEQTREDFYRLKKVTDNKKKLKNEEASQEKGKVVDDDDILKTTGFAHAMVDDDDDVFV